MKKDITQKQKWSRILAVIIFLSGTALLIYMIRVEDEPGALPLILIILGVWWFFLTQRQIKKQPHNAN